MLYLLPLKQDELHCGVPDRSLCKLLFRISGTTSAAHPDILLHHVDVSVLLGGSQVDYERIQKGLGVVEQEEQERSNKDCALAGQNERVFAI